ncbi:hypothetical protein VB773_17090 [Haloarculaceae archaeon H-GB2-1]|nr:hypothetical protein [Haloarculaceae archaeon H-GB1-1]MEA5387628.1 hypothetical protein [Haloarculaceae archaeon H-GB11]MEA5409115.1 hypothetical protein [Haloarculaceae archaeon H-GB2-1]
MTTTVRQPPVTAQRVPPRRVDVTDATYGDVVALGVGPAAYFERRGGRTELVAP